MQYDENKGLYDRYDTLIREIFGHFTFHHSNFHASNFRGPFKIYFRGPFKIYFRTPINFCTPFNRTIFTRILDGFL